MGTTVVAVPRGATLAPRSVASGRIQVKRLIAGPGVYTCDQCIGLCNEILAERDRRPTSEA